MRGSAQNLEAEDPSVKDRVANGQPRYGAVPGGKLADSQVSVRLEGLTKQFPSNDPSKEEFTAVRDVSLDVQRGEFLAIIGPSGCGKSTLLRVISGLTHPTRGKVLVQGQEVRGINRQVGFLFQDDALLPWRTVFDNVALGLRFQGVRDVGAQVNRWLERVGLAGFEDRYPAQLSGGMRKRVAIAQTLITEPDILLMDEPFTGLDAQTKHLMAQDLMDLAAGNHRTCIFVTHDLDDAIAMADRIALMTAGPAGTIKRLEAVDIPRPRNLRQVRSHPRFGSIGEALWEHLYVEVRRAYGR